MNQNRSLTLLAEIDKNLIQAFEKVRSDTTSSQQTNIHFSYGPNQYVWRFLVRHVQDNIALYNIERLTSKHLKVIYDFVNNLDIKAIKKFNTESDQANDLLILQQFNQYYFAQHIESVLVFQQIPANSYQNHGFTSSNYPFYFSELSDREEWHISANLLIRLRRFYPRDLYNNDPLLRSVINWVKHNYIRLDIARQPFNFFQQNPPPETELNETLEAYRGRFYNFWECQTDDDDSLFESNYILSK